MSSVLEREEGGFYQERAWFWSPPLLLDSDDVDVSKEWSYLEHTDLLGSLDS